MASEMKIYAMTARNPWAYLIAKGYKKIENRHKGISDTKWNKPVALSVAKKQYSSAIRHHYYELPVVQECLKLDEQTKDIYNDNDKLDAFFSDLAGKIIGIVYIEKTMKSKDNDQVSHYKFANVPKQDGYHWIITNPIDINLNPIPKFNGCLGVKEITNDDETKNKIKQIIQ